MTISAGTALVIGFLTSPLMSNIVSGVGDAIKIASAFTQADQASASQNQTTGKYIHVYHRSDFHPSGRRPHR